jgi:hypothetical protein
METQICNVCGEEKLINMFEHQKNIPNPRKTCKLCRSKKQWKSIKENKDKHSKYL